MLTRVVDVAMCAAAFAGPVFRHAFTSIASLKAGDRLNGVIANVTTFGAFVDIGVGSNGLIHKSTLIPEDADDLANLLQVRRDLALLTKSVREIGSAARADPRGWSKCGNRTAQRDRFTAPADRE